MTANNSPAQILAKVFRIFGCLIVGIALVELVIGMMMLNSAWERRDTWNRGTATVKAMEKVESTSNSGVTWRPVFTLSSDGREYTIRSSTSSNPPAYEVGEQVEMLYPAENPKDAVTNDFKGQYLWATVILGMSGMTGLMGGVFILIGLYLRRRTI